MRAVVLDFFEIYDLSISNLKDKTIIDKHVSFFMRTTFAFVLISAIIRLSSWSIRQEQIAIAQSKLTDAPEYAIRLGKRMIRPLYRYLKSTPTSSHYSEFSGKNNALVALAVLEGDYAIPLLQKFLNQECYKLGAVEGLLSIGSPLALEELMRHPEAWKVGICDKPEKLWRKLLGFSRQINQKRTTPVLNQAMEFYKNSDVPDVAKHMLLQMIAIACGRYHVSPFSTEDILEWQAKEVGYQFGMTANEKQPIVSSDIIDFFANVLSDSNNGTTQFIALCGLDWIGVPEKWEIFDRLVSSDVQYVRLRAIMALGRCGDGRGSRKIIGKLEELSSPLERFVALDALCRLRDLQALSVLLRILTDEAVNNGKQGRDYGVHNLLCENIPKFGKEARKKMLKIALGATNIWTARLIVRSCFHEEPSLASGFGRQFIEGQNLILAGEAASGICADSDTETKSLLHSTVVRACEAVKTASNAIRIAQDTKKDLNKEYHDLGDLREALASLLFSVYRVNARAKSDKEMKTAKRLLKQTQGLSPFDHDRPSDVGVMEMIGGRYVERTSGHMETVGKHINWKLLLLTGGKV